jgi:putative DNA methylase
MTTPHTPIRKKLIEVSIPLEDINAESAREKSIRHGHPSTLHLWWARRPLVVARAVLFAQLVDDPSSDPDLTEEQQKVERERLHGVIRRLVKWENVNNETVLHEAHQEILKSTGGNPPAILDPFAGGGTIPLEAQRLGLEAHASDLNPVAVLINKALIEIPPKFAGRPPVYPGTADTKLGTWPRAAGLAEDVRRYGAWIRDEAQERIGHLYPDATIVDEKTKTKTKATTIAWIWARTVTCPNPACGIEMPLVRSWWLGKKKGKEAYVVPTVVEDACVPGGRRFEFTIGRDKAKGPPASTDGTVHRQGAVCVACQSAVELKYVREQGRAKRMGSQLLAVVAEGNRQRIYIAPEIEQIAAAGVPRPHALPSQSMPDHSVSPAHTQTIKIYGFDKWVDLFSNRQLVALTTFSDLVGEARERVSKDALAAGLPSGARLADGGDGAEAYADAVATYLALSASKMAVFHCTLARWRSDADKTAPAFGRQAIPMVWDYAEAQPFAGAGGDWYGVVDGTSRALEKIDPTVPGSVTQADAATRDYSEVVVSTDPPYYDNIGYSDLSDFFYVWLRLTSRSIYPGLFSSILVPKAEELVANPYRHNGAAAAEKFFESGFEHVFSRARESASEAFPVTVYYAFKQTELEKEGISSTGWATILAGMIREGWTISATWPVRTENENRLIGRGSNALASSIVLVLRPRNNTAGQTTRRGFLAALRRDLPEALENLRQGAIAPVDLTQATIGPGMAVFSSYARVVENDGSDMNVKAALRLINQALDEVLAEGEGDLDADTRFCLKWYEQYGWDKGLFGNADVLARSYNTSVRGIADSGVLTQGEGIVQLVAPANLPKSWDPAKDDRISAWEVMCHLGRLLSAEDGGVEPAAKLMAAAATRPEIDIEAVQRLAYRLYEMTKTSRTDDARLFNLVGGSWTDLTQAASRVRRPDAVQTLFDFEDEN